MVVEPLAGKVGPGPGSSKELRKLTAIAPGDGGVALVEGLRELDKVREVAEVNRVAGKAGETGKLAGGPRWEKAGFIAGAGILIDGGPTAQ